MEGSICSGLNVGPTLEDGALGKGCMAPQAVKFRREVERSSVSIFFGSSIPFGLTHLPVSVDVETIVISIEGEITVVERVKGAAVVTEGRGIKTTGSKTHVRFISIGHSVTIGVRKARIEIDSVVVFIQLPRQATRESRCRTVGWIGPTKLLCCV